MTWSRFKSGAATCCDEREKGVAGRAVARQRCLRLAVKDEVWQQIGARNVARWGKEDVVEGRRQGLLADGKNQARIFDTAGGGQAERHT